jgi:GH15 family glucan-1,4-alpha-glucosidase
MAIERKRNTTKEAPDFAYRPIEDHGVIGDMRTMALVSLDGAIDFFCLPDFDSPSVFASLLDHRRGGQFGFTTKLADVRYSQIYVPDTNVLITRFLSLEGILEITDFMPIGGEHDPSRVIRILRSVRGAITLDMSCFPAFDYGRARHQLHLSDDSRTMIFSGDKEQSLCLQSTIDLHGERGAATAHFTLEPGEVACFMLSITEDKNTLFSREFCEKLETENIFFWRDWVSQIKYRGRWRDIVNRSALTLKLLTSRRFGSTVAAPTFGLPESIGGERNWDYRYCWIRDSAFTIYAFIRLGLKEEAVAFSRWIEEIYKQVRESAGELQLMYRIDGSSSLEERELDHFEGYMNSKPVRIGNDAYHQFQLDIYGELLDAIALANEHITKISYDAWQNIIRTADYVCDNWKKPDAGIWEFRGECREFLHSRLMCWVALDRALRLARDESLPAKTIRWMETRSEIYNDIFANFWDEELQSFVQHKHAKTVDASMLLMPLVDFIGARDPRWLSTLNLIGKRLASDSLVYRYRLDEIDLVSIDGSEEGSFNACSFWYIACLARAGRQDEAWLSFSKMLSYANHLGLYAEETGNDGRQLGNFPQAFTHLALINAVFALEEANQTERAPSR